MIRQGISLFGKALRETGQALDRVGLRIAEKELFNETFSRHRQLMTIFNKVHLDPFSFSPPSHDFLLFRNH
jgi:hypothetical protein